MPGDLEVVIVAIPREDDYVWKVSSEKIPHMTLLYLGDTEVTPHMVQYVQHAASLFNRFGMSVDRRGKLGDSEADVLFFDKNYSYRRALEFRGQLMADREISVGYHSSFQYPEWTPHLTLGFPDTPAKPVEREYGINWVEFDRIAIWTNDSEGPTFDLKDRYDMELAMSSIPRGASLDDVLEHYGVKGMKWGVRKKSRQTESTSADADRVNAIKTRVKTQKTTKVLTNQELRDALDRMRLEQEFSKLSGGIDKTRSQKSKAFITKLLVDTGKQTADQVVKTQTRGLVDEAMKKASTAKS